MFADSALYMVAMRHAYAHLLTTGIWPASDALVRAIDHDYPGCRNGRNP